MTTKLLEQLRSIGIELILIGNDLDIEGTENVFTDELLGELKAHKTELINAIQSNLDWWLNQLKQCATKQEIFNLLRQFQPLSWTDIERATMAYAYHRRLGEVQS